MTKICIVPTVQGIGGMVSFKHKFSAGLAARNIAVTDDPEDKYDALLVISGTRQLGVLKRARQRGVRVVQRLDGINWVQRRKRTTLKYFLRAETGNLLLAFLRAFYAERVIYQSQFVQHWWEGWYGALNKPVQVIYNGVDLKKYAPGQNHLRPTDKVRILVVEGSLTEGQSVGLTWAVDLAERLHAQRPTELMIAAQVTESQRAAWQSRARVPLNFLGTVPREKIPELHASAHFYFSAELNPPCPNSVIEALACGSPVVGFDSGAMKELVTPEAGIISPYGADPWKVQPPNVVALAEKIPALLSDLPRYQAGARRRAEEAFSLDTMVEKYLNVLLG